MPIIVVMNRQSGSGKSALATQLVAWYASRGVSVTLGDNNRPHAAVAWLGRRGHAAPKPNPGSGDPGSADHAAGALACTVVDTPSGIRGPELARQLLSVDAVVVPVGPSVQDMHVSTEFLQEVYQHPQVASGRCEVVLVGMRWPLEVVRAWCAQTRPRPLSLLTIIAEAPVYRHCLETGASIFDADVRTRLTPEDLLQWQPLLDWLERLALSGQERTPPGAPAVEPPPTRSWPTLSSTRARVPREAAAKPLRSPEAFLETRPPDDIAPAELLAARLRMRQQLGHSIPRPPAAAGTAQPPLDARTDSPATPEVTPSPSCDPPSAADWLLRGFRAR